jgi:hypothetical protein
MKSQQFKFFIIFSFLFLVLNAKLFAQSKYKETCLLCDGRGKTESAIRKPCPNCTYWTKYQREVNPCRVCRNTRSVSSGKYNICYRCKGKGYEMLWKLSPNLANIQLHTRGLFTEEESNREFWQYVKLIAVSSNELRVEIPLKPLEKKAKGILTFFENGDANNTLMINGVVQFSINGSWSFQNNDMWMMSHHFEAIFKAPDGTIISKFNSKNAKGGN